MGRVCADSRAAQPTTLEAEAEATTPTQPDEATPAARVHGAAARARDEPRALGGVSEQKQRSNPNL